MLNPSMQELMKRVGNRYLLVNLAAQRARDIADEAEEKGEPLPDKAVKLALDEIAAGKIVYRPGPRVETAIPQNNAIAAAMVDVDDTLDLDEDEEHTDSTPMNGGGVVERFLEQGDGRISLPAEPAQKSEPTAGKQETQAEGKEIFTEIMASIYIKQGKYESAVKIIRQLSLKYPKKNRYFADQIRFLEKLVLNDKNK